MQNSHKNSSASEFKDSITNIEQNLERGAYDNAATACVKLVKTFPEKAIAWRLLSKVSLRLGKLTLAIDAALNAIQSDKNDTSNYAALARSYLAAHEWKQAKRALELASEKVQENDPDKLAELGTLLYEDDQLSASIGKFDQALSIDNKHAPSLFNRAAILRFLGKTEESEQDYLTLLEDHPGDFEACYNLLQLKTYQSSEEILTTIRRCEALNTNNWQADTQLSYAKGKYYEDTKNYEDAFSAYSQAAKIKRSNTTYDLKKDLHLMEALPSVFTPKGRLGNSANDLELNHSSTTPIFVVGLPRSGTTLVERILSSHSAVLSGGELNSLPLAIMEAIGLNCLSDPFQVPTEHWLKVEPAQLEKIRERYLQLSLDRISPSKEPTYFVDKLPFNYLFCGHILKAFPKAKIIQLKRDPLDSVFSQYKMLFKHGYNYSYDLKELSQYIIAYENLMAKWKQLFPGKIYELQYENLVNNNRSEISKLLTFCDLDIQTNCFEFYNNTQASKTASASQIRQPIHNNSTGNWRHYLRQLSPVIESFDTAGIDVSIYKGFQ